MNAPAIFATPTQAALAKARSDRAAALARNAELGAARAAALHGAGDVAAIDKIDGDKAAELRAVTILDQRISTLDAEISRQQREERETRRGSAIKGIGAKLRRRQALAQEIEDALARVATLYNELNDDAEIRAAWPFGAMLPHYFNWRSSRLAWEVMRTFARECRDILPAEVRNVIAASHGGDGVTRAATPPMPKGVAEVYASHAAHVLNMLAKVNIHPPGEDDDSAGGVAA
jgi:hypothetical protein